MKDNLSLLANAFSSVLMGYGGKGYESSIKVYKFSGLNNLGSTCYMNSLLQQVIWKQLIKCILFAKI